MMVMPRGGVANRPSAWAGRADDPDPLLGRRQKRAWA
eukprot:CAMPEP_0174736056 /NCGR_PEP_ID=MMETSP1094-20130205/66000_1 /TAXON_ID=156173 /ORGANISM="Chrysochromulina brevifilum, Strain UTEX LB 985" /LENGTH=36 /DNA_ID= /DNA_START= /DNA_END= /DNA_ORIENTATION=